MLTTEEKPEEAFVRCRDRWTEQVLLSHGSPLPRGEVKQSYKLACDATDRYLESLGIQYLGEIAPHARLLLAQGLAEELPRLELLGSDGFIVAKAELFNAINAALAGFDLPPHEWPSNAELVELLTLIGCNEKGARNSFDRIITKLRSGKI